MDVHTQSMNGKVNEDGFHLRDSVCGCGIPYACHGIHSREKCRNQDRETKKHKVTLRSHYWTKARGGKQVISALVFLSITIAFVGVVFMRDTRSATLMLAIAWFIAIIGLTMEAGN